MIRSANLTKFPKRHILQTISIPLGKSEENSPTDPSLSPGNQFGPERRYKPKHSEKVALKEILRRQYVLRINKLISKSQKNTALEKEMRR